MLLKSEGVYLRFLRRTDARSCYDAICESRTELEPYTFLSQLTQCLEDEQRFIENDKQARKLDRSYVFGIFDSRTKAYIGGVGYLQTSRISRIWEIGYWVRTSRAGCGYATRAIALSLPFVFEKLEAHKVSLRHTIDNDASRHLAERFGFVFEGTQRQEKPRNGGWVDLRCYSMLETEYFDNQNRIVMMQSANPLKRLLSQGRR